MPKLGNIGAKVDLLVRQAMTLGPYQVIVNQTEVLPKTPVDLTGCTISGQVRKLLPLTSPPSTLPDANDPYALDFDISIVDAVAGIFEFGLTSQKTDSLLPGLTVKDPNGQYSYDLQIKYPDNTIRPLLHGVLTSYREVTRDV